VLFRSAKERSSERSRKGQFKTNANVAQFLLDSIHVNRIPLRTAKRALPEGKTSNLNEAGVYAAAMQHMIKTPLYKKHPDTFRKYYKELKGIYTKKRRGVENNSNTLRSDIATMNEQELRELLHDIEEELKAFKPMTSYFGKHTSNERKIATMVRQWLKASRNSVRQVLRQKYGVNVLANAPTPTPVPALMNEVIVVENQVNKNNAPLLEEAERIQVLSPIQQQSISNQSKMNKKPNSFFGRFTSYFARNKAATKKKNNNANRVNKTMNNKRNIEIQTYRKKNKKQQQEEDEEEEGESTALLVNRNNGNYGNNGNNRNNGKNSNSNNNETSVRKRLLSK